MGTKSTDILGSDQALDAYYDYVGPYNRGVQHADILAAIEQDEPGRLNRRPSSPDEVDWWLGLSLAMWERKTFEPAMMDAVETLIADGLDASRWVGSGFEEERRRVLAGFVEQLRTPPRRARARRRPTRFQAPFKTGQLLTWQRQDGTWGGAACVGASGGWAEIAHSVLVVLHVREAQRPSRELLLDADVVQRHYGKWDGAVAIGCASINPRRPKPDLPLEVVGTVELSKCFGDLAYSMRDWGLDATLEQSEPHRGTQPGRTLRAFLEPPSEARVRHMMEQIGVATRDGWNQRNNLSAYDHALAAWHQLGWPVSVSSAPAIEAVTDYFGVNADRARHILGWVVQHGTHNPGPPAADVGFAQGGPGARAGDDGAEESRGEREEAPSPTLWQRTGSWLRDRFVR